MPWLQSTLSPSRQKYLVSLADKEDFAFQSTEGETIVQCLCKYPKVLDDALLKMSAQSTNLTRLSIAPCALE